MQKDLAVRAGRAAAIYAAVALLWIWGSDWIVATLLPDAGRLHLAESAKGTAFVVVTALLLFFFVRREMQAHEAMVAEKQRHAALLSAVADNTTDAIFVKDRQGRFLFFNRAAAAVVGKSAADVLGKDETYIFPPDVAGALIAIDRKIMEEGQVVVRQDFVVDAKGEKRLFLSTKGPVRDGKGDIVGVYGIARDITESDRAEEAARQIDARYRSLFENMLNGFAYCRMLFKDGRPTDFVYLSVNRAFEVLTGLKNVVGKKVSEVIPGIRDADPKLMETYGRVALGGPPERFETYVASLKMWFEIAAYSPQREHFVALFDVITERKRAEEELRTFKEFAETSAQGFGMATLDGVLTYVNAALARIAAEEGPDRMRGRSMFEYYDSREQALLREVILPAVHRDGHWEGELTGHNARGERVPTFISFFLLRDEGGAARQLAGVVTDIAERKRAEEQLRLEAAALEAAANGIVITDREGRIVWANAAVSAMTGYAVGELLGQNPRKLKSGRHNQAFYKHLWDTILAGEVWRGELMNQRKDGTLYHEEMTITPVRSAAGEVTHFIAIKQDVTERRHLQEQLQQGQKMETIGRLAGGVAHDFNNILQAMLGYTEILLNEMPEGDARRGDLVEVQKAGKRAADLTRQLLAMGRKQHLDPRVTDLNALIEDLNKMLARVLGEDIEIRFALAPDLDRVMVDATQISQILLNLALNARDAMPGGGLITFTTTNAAIMADDVPIQPEARAGRFVCCAVSDTGTGMPPEVRSRIFEPFFTTKAPGKGTGLGLATAYGIARQHNGWMSVYSQEGSGTSFKLWLPAVAKTGGEQPPLKEEASATALSGSGERILMVEDDPVIRKLVHRQLERHGYHVVAAGTAAEAMRAFSELQDLVDLVFTDVVLPDISGLELLDQLRARRPDLRVLVTSGYADNESRWPVILKRRWRFLSKPYTSLALLKALRQVLDKDGPQAARTTRAPA